MVIYFLMGACALCLVLVVVAMLSSSKRGSKILELEAANQELVSKSKEIETRFESKCRQADKTINELNKVKDEVKKAKKKVYFLECGTKNQFMTTPEDRDLDLALQDDLGKARLEIKNLQSELKNSQEESNGLKMQTERQKTELSQARKLSKVQTERKSKDANRITEKVSKLEDQCRILNKKLDSARRKARTDQQVYIVTNSKLELAMEKIKFLESSKNPNKEKQEDSKSTSLIEEAPEVENSEASSISAEADQSLAPEVKTS